MDFWSITSAITFTVMGILAWALCKAASVVPPEPPKRMTNTQQPMWLRDMYTRKD